MISELPNELQLMVAEFYFANPDTALSFYDKWCLSKRFDKHFGTRSLNKKVLMCIRLPSSYDIITTGNPRMVVDFSLPTVTQAPCINGRQNTMQLFKYYEDDRDIAPELLKVSYSVYSKRWLPCLGCQRKKECTQCPLQITSYWQSCVLFPEEIGFHMSMRIHHPFPIEYLDIFSGDNEATVLKYESTVVPYYYPKQKFVMVNDEIEELPFTKGDFKEVISRYNLHRYLM